MILQHVISDKIARVSDVFDCHVCEVGAGPGSLTRSLLRAGAKHVGAVEIDGRFLPSLEVRQYLAMWVMRYLTILNNSDNRNYENQLASIIISHFRVVVLSETQDNLLNIKF